MAMTFPSKVFDTLGDHEILIYVPCNFWFLLWMALRDLLPLGMDIASERPERFRGPRSHWLVHLEYRLRATFGNSSELLEYHTPPTSPRDGSSYVRTHRDIVGAKFWKHHSAYSISGLMFWINTCCFVITF